MISEPNASFDDITLLMERASLSPTWYVIVVPSEEQLESFRKSVATASPPGSKVGGRTVLLPSGSRVSSVVVDDPVHIPKGTSFTVVFMGRWCEEKQQDRWSKQMDRWRREAEVTLTSLLS